MSNLVIYGLVKSSKASVNICALIYKIFSIRSTWSMCWNLAYPSRCLQSKFKPRWDTPNILPLIWSTSLFCCFNGLLHVLLAIIITLDLTTLHHAWCKTHHPMFQTTLAPWQRSLPSTMASLRLDLPTQWVKKKQFSNTQTAHFNLPDQQKLI